MTRGSQHFSYVVARAADPHRATKTVLEFSLNGCMGLGPGCPWFRVLLRPQVVLGEGVERPFKSQDPLRYCRFGDGSW